MKKTLMVVLILIVAGVGIFFLFFQGDEEVGEVYTEYVPGDFFVTNVKDSRSIVKVTVVLVLNTDAHEAMLTENNSLIRDAIVFILRSQTVETYLSQEGGEIIKKEILSKLNEKLEINNIVDVYFNDFVMQ